MAPPARPHRTGNRLLDRLPQNEYESLLGFLEPVTPRHKEQIYEQKGPANHVDFPQTGLFSSVVHAAENLTIEAGAVGNEGLLGLPVYLGLDFSLIRSVMQVPGKLLRMRADAFLHAVRPGSTLERLIRRYMAFYLRYASQSVACNALHSVEERISKWICMAHDRVEADSFLLTQEYLAEMIGARRQTVSIVASTLQRAGLIRYQRGTMQILDREGLEAASCECYGIIKDFYALIME